MWLCFYIPVHNIKGTHKVRTIIECFGDIYFKEMLLINVVKILDAAKNIVDRLCAAHAIQLDHSHDIEAALKSMTASFVGLSQLGCAATKEYKNEANITDQEFLGIPRISGLGSEADRSHAFEWVPWTITPTMELGRWLGVFAAMIFG